MQRNKKRWFAFFALLIMAIVLYTIYDDNRFIITKQEIYLENLPEEFDGYQILQISDLHEKSFGEGQSKLLAAVNSIDFDCMLLTGDMNQYEDSSIASSQAVLDLLSGLETETLMIWVDGNTGPFAAESTDGTYTGELTEIGQTLSELGVTVLLEPVEICRNGKSIWFVPELSLAEMEMNYPAEDAYGQLLLSWYDRLNGNGDVKIRVNHYPIQANLTEETWDVLGYLDYDLSIAGHYHGGQIRLPFFGALYIPCPTAGINGYFPKQSEVKGLNQIINMQQYISAGLGSSGSVSFLNFRLFNTPEINVITLRCG